MKRKKALCVFLTLSLSFFSFSEASNIQEIKKNKCYIWGEGISNNPSVADEDALLHLTSQISVKVESNFENMVKEIGGDIEEYTKKVVKTYSNVMLDEAKSIQEEKGGKFHVLRYTTQEDYKKIFKKRELLIRDLVADGIKAEENMDLGNALQSYYWAMCLLRTHPDMDEMRDKCESNSLYIITLPRRIDRILASVNIKVKSTKYNETDGYRKTILEFTSGGKKISNLDFKYYSGNGWTRIMSNVNDGLAMVEYFGAQAKSISDVKLRIEYIYENKPKYNKSLENAISMAYRDIPYFRKSQKKVDHTWKSNQELKEKVRTKAVGVMLTVEEEKGKDKQCFETVMKFRNAFDEKNKEEMLSCFTPEGLMIYSKLMLYGNALRVPQEKTNLQCGKVNDKYVVRSIPYQFTFPQNRRKFIEKVVFILNEDAKICGINFALSDISINDIMDKPEAWGSMERRQQIVHFMESYKTAYCLENIDYIEKIFSDEALIIVGQNLQSEKNIDSMYTSKLNKKEVRFIRMNKQQYLERLRRIFANSEAINIHFEDTEVKRMQRKDDYTYGIQIAQNYYSSTYADRGYLFLLFDINDQNEPKIFVRSWQPEKSPDGTIIGLSNFVF